MTRGYTVYHLPLQDTRVSALCSGEMISIAMSGGDPQRNVTQYEFVPTVGLSARRKQECGEASNW